MVNVCLGQPYWVNHQMDKK